MVGKTDFDFFSPEFTQRTFAAEQEIVRTGTPILKTAQEQVQLLRQSVVWAESSKAALRDESGSIVANVNLEMVMELGCRRLVELTGAEGACVLMLEDDEFRFRATTGFGVRNANTRLPLEGTLTGWAVPSQQIGDHRRQPCRPRMGDHASRARDPLTHRRSAPPGAQSGQIGAAAFSESQRLRPSHAANGGACIRRSLRSTQPCSRIRVETG